MPDRVNIPKEGDLYMQLEIHGYLFELRYGYYEESDRKNGEPVVIYPDFINNPLYNARGYPLVTAVQIPCEHYTVERGSPPEDCCSDCIYYKNSKNEIDICLCEKRRAENISVHNDSGGDTK